MRLYTSVVDQDVDAAPLIANLLDHRLHRHLASHIEDKILANPTIGGDAPHRLIQIHRGEIVRSHPGSLSGECHCQRTPDAPTGASDQHYFPFEFAHITSVENKVQR